MEPFDLTAGPLVLDQPTRADVPLITEYCQDPLFEAFMTLPWPYEPKHAEFFVDEFVPRGWSSDTEVTWALRRDGEFLGVVGLRKNTMIGFWLGAPHRGSGYTPLAVNAVVDWAFESGWVPEVRWEAIVGNTASLAVARKAGFTYTGVESAMVTGRDGSHPDSWQAVLRPTDSRSPKTGWPA
ncbi:GNAT family N-acetyltransferase [Cryobacterium sp. BB307]|uniref:GNAT family N-acetyltransferase n=1 Tax=Cryobacterium sp. BB307 TaxID=2716317 RepID=UPI0014450F14